MATDQQERTYTIPLRKAILKAPKYRRAKRAMSEIRIFLKRHLKTETVKIGKHLNEHMWNHGMRNPPAKVKINAARDEEGVGYAELFGKPLVMKKEEKKEKKEQKEEEKPKEEKPEEQKAGEAKPTAPKKGGSEPKLGKKALKEQLEKELKQKGEAAERKPAPKKAPARK